MTRPVINVADVPLQARPPMFQPTGDAAARYGAQMGLIGPKIGMKKLGCNLTAVPPGLRAYPLHNHLANEELFFILQGTGELRMGGESHPLRPGDVVACPPGGAELAHQIVNTGSEELRYLAISTKLWPEIVEYPDSGKFAVLSERPPAADGAPRMFRHIGREGQGLDYWDGE